MGLGRDLGTHMKPQNPIMGMGIVVAILALKFRSQTMLFAGMALVVADFLIETLGKKTGAGAKMIIIGAFSIGCLFIAKGAFNGGDYQLMGQFANWFNNFLSGP